MMYANLNVYALTSMPTDKNSIFPLGDATPAFSVWTQIRDIDLGQRFIINKTDAEAYDFTYAKRYNYIKVIFATTKNVASATFTACYFIDNIYRNAENSIIIDATADVLNTLEFEIDTFTKNCNIERSHLDRWMPSSDITKMVANIDFHQEDFTIDTKYLASSTKIGQTVTGYSGTIKWYVLYYSDPEAKTGVRTFLIPETTASMTVREPHSSSITVVADTYYILRKEDNNYRTITNGTATFTFGSTGYEYEELHIYNYGGTQRMILYKWNLHDAGSNWKSFESENGQFLNTPDGTFSSDGDMIYYVNPLHKMSLLSFGSAFPFINPTRNYNPQYTTNTSRSVSGLNALDLKNTRFIKIISLPYFPFTSTSDANLTYRNVSDDFMNVNMLEVADGVDLGKVKLQNSYTVDTYEINKPTALELIATQHDDKWETKYLSSEYNYAAFEYSAYKFICMPELYKLDDSDGVEAYTVYFKNGRLSSNLLFKLEETGNAFKDEFAGTAGSTGLAGIESRYIISDIPNEIPIYNNEYINYIKNGYNYDKETLARQTEKGFENLSAQAIGSILSIGVSVATGNPIAAAGGIGLATSSFQQANSIIQNQIQGEANIKRKLNEYKNSQTAVSAVNGIDLRKEYEADGLYLRKYEISKTLKTYLCEFWRNYGYKVNAVDNPYTFIANNKRHNYNFIKLSNVEFNPQFTKKYIKISDWLEVYKNKFIEGVTIFNRDSDYGKITENFEQWLYS